MLNNIFFVANILRFVPTWKLTFENKLNCRNKLKMLARLLSFGHVEINHCIRPLSMSLQRALIEINLKISQHLFPFEPVITNLLEKKDKLNLCRQGKLLNLRCHIISPLKSIPWLFWSFNLL